MRCLFRIRRVVDDDDEEDDEDEDEDEEDKDNEEDEDDDEDEENEDEDEDEEDDEDEDNDEDEEDEDNDEDDDEDEEDDDYERLQRRRGRPKNSERINAQIWREALREGASKPRGSLKCKLTYAGGVSAAKEERPMGSVRPFLEGSLKQPCSKLWQHSV
uniref:Uncharacterized protein n=1 Tax=Vespula pensylvanica TaxID=30213 RepID=A0A834P6F1_VESPE|nr:hypothetical protein H0235_006241 [Vespula pensylvanica]